MVFWTTLWEDLLKVGSAFFSLLLVAIGVTIFIFLFVWVGGFYFRKLRERGRHFIGDTVFLKRESSEFPELSCGVDYVVSETGPEGGVRLIDPSGKFCPPFFGGFYPKELFFQYAQLPGSFVEYVPTEDEDPVFRRILWEVVAPLRVSRVKFDYSKQRWSCLLRWLDGELVLDEEFNPHWFSEERIKFLDTFQVGDLVEINEPERLMSPGLNEAIGAHPLPFKVVEAITVPEEELLKSGHPQMLRLEDLNGDKVKPVWKQEGTYTYSGSMFRRIQDVA